MEILSYNANWTSVVNEALTRLGRPLIQSLEDKTQDCSIILSLLPTAIGVPCEAHNWSFLKTESQLPKNSETVNGKNTFNLPEDFARLVRVETEGEWEIFEDKIVTASASCRIAYVRLPINPLSLSVTFRNAISSYLGYLASTRLSGNQSIAQALYSEYITALEQCKFNEESLEVKASKGIYWEDMKI